MFIDIYARKTIIPPSKHGSNDSWITNDQRNQSIDRAITHTGMLFLHLRVKAISICFQQACMMDFFSSLIPISSHSPIFHKLHVCFSSFIFLSLSDYYLKQAAFTHQPSYVHAFSSFLHAVYIIIIMYHFNHC